MKKQTRIISWLLVLCMVLSFGVLAAPAQSEALTGIEVNLAQGVPDAEGAFATISQPVIAGGNIYVALQLTVYDEMYNAEIKATQLVKISPTGEILARTDLPKQTYYNIPITSDGDDIYVGLSGGAVVSIDAATMAINWETPAIEGIDVTTELTVDSGTLYFGTYYSWGSVQSVFCSVDTADGSVVSTINCENSYGSKPVINGDAIYLGSESGKLMIFSVSDGTSYTTVDVSDDSIRSAVAISADNTAAIVNTLAGTTYQVSLSDGVVSGDVTTYDKINRITVPSIVGSGVLYTAGEAYDASGYGTVLGGYFAAVTATGTVELQLPNHTKSTPVLVEGADGINSLYMVTNYNAVTYENDGSLIVVTHDIAAQTMAYTVLYTPTDAARNASTSSVVFIGENLLAYTADSGYLFLVDASPEEDDPKEEPGTEVPGDTDGGDTPVEENPNTGDTQGFWMMTLLVSGGMCLYLYNRKVRNH